MFALSILAAFAALLVLAAWSGAFPPIKRNAEHDRNYAFHITMRSRSHAKYLVEPWNADLTKAQVEGWLDAMPTTPALIEEAEAEQRRRAAIEFEWDEFKAERTALPWE